MKKKVILIGAGSRGMGYTDIMKNTYDNDFEVIAVAEPVEDRRNYIKEKHGVSENMCFETWEPLLALPKMADVVIVSTMDRDHKAPALAAIEKGYNLLLEKPAAATPEECVEIMNAAEAKGVFVLICHVLRYTKFFMALKDIIDSGEIGEVKGIQHLEGVGNIHQSHSYVRGNWHNSEESAMMLLAKSCHDIDILAWLIGKKCKKAQSFGSLSYFVRENAPEGSPERCLDDCPVGDTCPYNAKKLYLDAKNNLWFRGAATKQIKPTDEEVKEALDNTMYGKCIYKCDNDVVDHQVVTLEFEDNVFVDFTMSAFTRGGRVLRIMGTKGMIEAAMEGNQITVFNITSGARRVHDCNTVATSQEITGGHGGGDDGIVFALKNLLNGEVSKSISGIRESCDNHMITFAAEESRLTGKIVDVEEFSRRYYN